MTERAEELPADPGEAYESLAALRVAHLDLMRARSKKDRGASSTATIRDFLRRAQRAGAFITDDEDRHKAQSILDYWSAELVSDSEGFDADFTPTLLAEADTARAAGRQSDQPELKLQQRRDDSREQVRTAAAARQWRDSGKDPGYLFAGAALDKAARFRGSDKIIDEFLDASEAARANSRKLKLYALGGVVLTVLCFFLLQFYGLPVLRDWAIATIKDPGALEGEAGGIKSRRLWLLGLYQSWLPPYDRGLDAAFVDISRPHLFGIYAPKLRLHAPNFSRATFINADFRDVDFANASFNESVVAGVTRFDRANLMFAKFRGSRIVSTSRVEGTSFAGASLFRAIFDRTYFSRVNFSGADLRRASFWSASFDGQFAQGFPNTAWWFAEGWSSCQVRALIEIPQDPNVLKESQAFKEEIKAVRDAFSSSAPGTLARARDLNQLAWTQAIWGVDLAGTDNPRGNSEADCLTATAVPGDALTAAKQAVCIGEKLAAKSAKDEDYSFELGNFRDTYGYVLLQTDQKEEAQRVLELAARNRSTGEVLFRSAVANYAAGKTERAEADFLGYAPSHELWNLRKYIRDMPGALEFVDRVWPASATTESCRER